jgi:hypothetical protein
MMKLEFTRVSRGHVTRGAIGTRMSHITIRKLLKVKYEDRIIDGAWYSRDEQQILFEDEALDASKCEILEEYEEFEIPYTQEWYRRLRRTNGRFT